LKASKHKNIPLRIGRNNQGFGFLNHHEYSYDANGQIIIRKTRLLEPLGIQAFNEDEIRPRISIQSNRITQAMPKAEINAAVKAYYVISPFAGWDAKNWDGRKYLDLARNFSSHSGLIPVFIGGAGENGKFIG
jgi:ADP-heptose:LPS heptosyltransferase